MPIERKYLVHPSIPDIRRPRLKLALPPVESPFPDYQDLRPGWPDVRDQGTAGTCAAVAFAAMMQRVHRQQGWTDFTPSPLFIYWTARALHGWQDADTGISLADGFTALAGQGICPESDWPYDLSKLFMRPPAQAFTNALKERATMWSGIDYNDREQLRACLNLDRAPIIGISVYSSFEQGPVSLSGVIPMPDANKDRLLGGHALIPVGYFTAGLQANHAGFPNAPESFIVRNSWGPAWGRKGYGALPVAYTSNPDLCWDGGVIVRET